MMLEIIIMVKWGGWSGTVSGTVEVAGEVNGAVCDAGEEKWGGILYSNNYNRHEQAQL